MNEQLPDGSAEEKNLSSVSGTPLPLGAGDLAELLAELQRMRDEKDPVSVEQETRKGREEADREYERLLAAKWVLQADVQKQIEEIRPGTTKMLVAKRTSRLEPGKKYLINGMEAPKDYEGHTYSREELRWQPPHDLFTVLLHPEYAAAMIEDEKKYKELLDKKYVPQVDVQKQIEEIRPGASNKLVATRTRQLKSGKRYLINGKETPKDYDGKTYSREELRWQHPHDPYTVLLHPEYAAAMIEAEKKHKKLLDKKYVPQDDVQKQIEEIRPEAAHGLVAFRTRQLKSGKKYLINGTEAPKDYEGKTYSCEELRWQHPHDKNTVLLHPEYAAAIIEAEKKYTELLDKKYVLQADVQRQIEEIRPGASNLLVAQRTLRLKSGKKYLINGMEAPKDYEGHTYSREELRWQPPHDLFTVLLHPEYAAAMIEDEKKYKELLDKKYVPQVDVQKQIEDIRPRAAKLLVAARTRQLKPGKKYLINGMEAPKDYEGKAYSREELRWPHPQDPYTVLLHPEYAAAMIEAEKKWKELLDKGYVLQTDVEKQIKKIRPRAGKHIVARRTRRLESGKKYLINGTEVPESYEGKTYLHEELRWRTTDTLSSALLHPEYAAAIIEAEKKYTELLDKKYVLQADVQRQIEEIRPGASNLLVAQRTLRLKSGKKYLINGTEAPKDYEGKTYSCEELRWQHPHDKNTVLLHPEYAAAMVEAERRFVLRMGATSTTAGDVVSPSPALEQQVESKEQKEKEK